MIGAVTATRQARSVGGMGLVGASVERSLGLGGIVPPPHAVGAVAEPWLAAIPAEGVDAAAGVFAVGLGLVGAGHAATSNDP